MIGYISLCVWTLFLIAGILRNYSHYSIADWVAMLFIWLVPCFLVYKYKTRKKKDARFKQPYLPLKICGVTTFGVICVAGITQHDAIESQNDFYASIFCGFIAIALLFSIFKTKKKIQTEITIQDERRQQLLNAIENFSITPLSNPNIMLKKDEVAFFEQSTTLLVTQNKAVGSTGRSSGLSVRVAKGIYLRSGGSGSQKIYRDVTTRFTGSLSITNQRISFMQAQKAFEIPLEKLTNTSASRNILFLQHGNKSYTLELQDADIVEQFIRKLCSEK